MHRYFYHNPVKGYNVPPDSAKSLEGEYMVDIIYDTIGDEPGSFFGVISPNNVTLQFYLEDYEDHIRMEIPDPAQNGSHAKYVSFEEALGVIKELSGNFTVEDFDGLAFESWSTT